MRATISSRKQVAEPRKENDIMENIQNFDYPTRKDQASPRGKVSGVTKFLFILAALFLIVALFFLMFRFFLLTGLCLFFAFWMRQKDLAFSDKSALTATGMCVIILLTIFTFLIPPIALETHVLWKYPIFQAYTDLYGNVRKPSWVPDFENDVRSDFTFNWVVSSFQGYGHWSVGFITDKEIAQRYDEKYKKAAIYTVPLNEIDSYTGFSIGFDRRAHVEYNNSFWKNSSNNATVYILYSSYDEIHPFTKAVIVDPDTGMVELIECG